MRKRNQIQPQHYGVVNGLKREGQKITSRDGKSVEHFASIRRAKRFMRTGNEERQ